MNLDYLYGINPIKEALRGRRRPVELFVDEKAGGKRIEEVLVLAKDCEVPVRQRRRQDLDRLAGLPHHQGVVMSMEPFPYTELEDLLSAWQTSGQDGFFLLLDGITDPHNLGAILRNADAAGCQGVVIHQGSQLRDYQRSRQSIGWCGGTSCRLPGDQPGQGHRDAEKERLLGVRPGCRRRGAAPV